MPSLDSIFPVSHQGFKDRCIYFKHGFAQTFEHGVQKESFFYREMRPHLKNKLDADCKKLCNLRLFQLSQRTSGIIRALLPSRQEKAKELTEWVCKKIGSAEYQSRVVAAEKILSAYLTGSELLDLKYLNLTDLPELLKSLDKLKTIHLTGNLLQKSALDVIKKLQGVKDTKNLERLIIKQDSELLNPIKFYDFVKPEDLKEPNRDWYENRKEIMAERLAGLLTIRVLFESKNIAISSPTQFETVIIPIVKALSLIAAASGIIYCAALFISAIQCLLCLVLGIITAAAQSGIESFKTYFKGLIASVKAFLVSHGLGNGADVSKIIKLCVKICEKIEKKQPLPCIQAFKEAIKDSYWECFSEKGLTRLQKGDLTVMSSGYYYTQDRKAGHHVCLVFYKNHMAICNRGQSQDNMPLRIYEIDRTKLNATLLTNLRNILFSAIIKGVFSDEFLRYYLYSALVQAIAIKQVRLPPSLNIKPQKVGNCAIASIKCAFLASAFLMQEKMTDETVHVAKNIKRQFSYRLRAYTLKKASSSPMQQSLLRRFNQAHSLSNAKKKLESYKARKLPAQLPSVLPP